MTNNNHLLDKIILIVAQTLFFFGAIMVVTFFAGVLFTTSQGNPFWPTFHNWVDKEVNTQSILLRLAASGIYVLFRNRKLILRRS